MKGSTRLLLALLIAPLLFPPAAEAQTPGNNVEGDAARGREFFLRNYCWSCHGYEGAGAVTGPRLSQMGFTAEGFTAFLRNPGRMPPFRTEVLTDSETRDIYAYIRTFPPPPPLDSIPLLNLD